ncbi:MAG: chromate transporter [Butyricicoccus sp.]|nr:chromate transporter [Butyricicoccus sp.]
MKELWMLFLTFAQIGGLTFGGGYAMLPMLQREVVERRGWATEEELTDYFAIGQCTPGIIAVNTATFVGYRNRGIPGALCATFGVVAPSLVIITIIAAFLQNFADYPIVQDAFAGIRVCVCVLILRAVEKLWKKSVVDRPALVICLFVFLLSSFLDLPPVPLILLAGIAGVVIKTISAKGGDRL